MPLRIALAPGPLDEGSPEERATFGRLSVDAGEVRLAEGIDTFARAIECGPLVPGYHVAQWFAWNWWRLRWEPRRTGESWAFAHRMATIGEGYVWPQIEVNSDGLRVLVQSRASRPGAKPFRYTTAQTVILPAPAFERSIDAFLVETVGQLKRGRVDETNLDRVWRDILRERSDPALGERRKLEALLGVEPDEEEGAIDRLQSDMEALGHPVTEEIAADGKVVSLADMTAHAGAVGFALDPADMVRLPTGPIRPDPAVAAWRVGRDAARQIRDLSGFGGDPISDGRLAALAGVDPRVLATTRSYPPFSFSLRVAERDEKIVLRSPIPVNRRFNLARVLGDRLVFGIGRVSPATQAYTYRQKVQRAFAAELLCPSEVISTELARDDGLDRELEIADEFGVSELVVRMVAERSKSEIDGEENDAELLAA